MSISNLFRKKPISKILQQGGDGEHSGLNKVFLQELQFPDSFLAAAIVLHAYTVMERGKPVQLLEHVQPCTW
jgi:hypothetical protein